MKVTSINLDDDEVPTEISVTMTLDEVVVIAQWTGGLSGTTSPAPLVTAGIYDTLIGTVVNRFWEGGMNDLKAMTVPTPHAGVTVTDEVVKVMARVICEADDSMYHHDRTDDIPCSACNATTLTALSATLPLLVAQISAGIAEAIRAIPLGVPVEMRRQMVWAEYGGDEIRTKAANIALAYGKDHS